MGLKEHFQTVRDKILKRRLTPVEPSHPAREEAVGEQVLFAPELKRTRARGTSDERKQKETIQFFQELLLKHPDEDFSAFLLKTPKEIFDVYQESSLFKNMYEMASNGKSKLKHIRGKMFADISFAYMSAYFTQYGFKVLSEEETMDIYQKVYPWASLHKDNLGMGGMHEIYVPDGVLVNREGLIAGVLEYSTSRNIERYKPKNEKFQGMINDMQGIIVDDPRFVIVSHGDIDVEAAKAISPSIDVVPLPFSHTDITRFVNKIYANPGPDGTLPLGEIGRREQLRKLDELSSFHNQGRALALEGESAV